MLDVFSASQTPVESWVKTALWYQATRRFLTATKIEDDGMNAALDELRTALETMGEAIVAVYGAAPTARHKRVAEIIPLAWDEILENSGESFTGLGGLNDLLALVKAGWGPLGKLGKWTWKYGKWVLLAWGFKECGIPVAKGGIALYRELKDLFQSEVDKAAAAHRLAQESAAKKVELIGQCQLDNAGNPAAIQECIKSVNESFAMVMPSGDCDMLDTPTGTALGGIFGLFAGYIAAEAALRQVE